MVLGVRSDVDIFKLTARAQSINSESLCTRILGVVSKHLRVLHVWVGDSTTSVNSLSPQMSELVEDAFASWCGDIVRIFSHQYCKDLQKFVELKFEIFSLNTFDVSQIFWQRVVQTNPNTVIAFSWRDCAGFLFVEYWITHCVPCLGCFLVFIFVPHCAINIWHHMLCCLPNICI